MADQPVAEAIIEMILGSLPPVTHPDEVVEGAALDEEGLGYDSIGLIDLLCECEEHFGVSLPPEVLFGDGTRRLTVADLIHEVSERLPDPAR